MDTVSHKTAITDSGLSLALNEFASSNKLGVPGKGEAIPLSDGMRNLILRQALNFLARPTLVTLSNLRQVR
jgi:hydrogenase maturation factor